jgi:hypothetical protein
MEQYMTRERENNCACVRACVCGLCGYLGRAMLNEGALIGLLCLSPLALLRVRVAYPVERSARASAHCQHFALKQVLLLLLLH